MICMLFCIYAIFQYSLIKLIIYGMRNEGGGNLCIGQKGFWLRWATGGLLGQLMIIYFSTWDVVKVVCSLYEYFVCVRDLHTYPYVNYTEAKNLRKQNTQTACYCIVTLSG